MREAGLDEWLANFSAQISASPVKYGLTPADAAQIAAAVAAWHAAYAAAAAPDTRTRARVQEKRSARAAVTAVVRRFAARIRSNDAVAADLKIGLGLVLRTGAGTPVPAPRTFPVLGLRRMDTRLHTLTASDEVPGRRGKPPRSAGLVVFRAVADGPVTHPERSAGVAYLGLFTRPRIDSAFTESDRGKTATYFARWVNAKGEPGPWSRPLSVAVAA